MKHAIKILTGIFCSTVCAAAFLMVSCDNKTQDRGIVTGADTAYSDSLMGQGKASYNERLAGQGYLHYCAPCHGAEGKGDGFNAVNLEKKPPDFTDTVYMKLLIHEYLVQAISVGGQAINKSPLMPAWGHTFTADDIQRLAVYVKDFGAGSLQE